MSRSVSEWIGKTDDSKAPPRVRIRVFERDSKRCQGCSIDLSDGRSFELDHTEAIILGGENRESNLRTLCKKCHKLKTAKDVLTKAITARKKLANHGVKPARPWSRFKKKMDGTVVDRETGEPVGGR